MNASSLITLTTTFTLATAVVAQPPHPEVTVDWTKIQNRIAWFGTWNRALAAAKSTGRPILLVAGAPHCQQVPGVW